MDKSKPFGLVIPKKVKAFQPKSAGIFGSDSDDEPSFSKKQCKIPQAKPISAIKTEDLEDPSIYEYDAIYDEMKAEKKAVELAPKEKKSSRYIDKLLKAADKRKKEYERRVEKKVQIEREKEGDEFEDKEMFVTTAYKKKLLEREEEEERERRENQLNDMMDVTKQNDLSGFYRHFLKQSAGEEKIPEIGEKFAIKKEPRSESEEEETPRSANNSAVKQSKSNEKKISSRKRTSSHSGEDSDVDEAGDQKDSDAMDRIKSSMAREETIPSCDTYADDKDDSDLNDSSSGSDSDEDTGNSYEKSVRQYRKKATHAEAPLKSLKRKADEVGKENDSLNSKEEKKVKANQEKNSKRSRHDSNSDSSDNNQKETKSDMDKNSSENKENARQFRSRNKRPKSSDESDSDDEPGENGENSEMLKKGENNEKGEENKPKDLKKIFEKRTVGDVFAAAQARYFQRLAART